MQQLDETLRLQS